MESIEHLRNFIETETEGLRYYVSTKDVSSYGLLETTVFAERDGIIDWDILHEERHSTPEEAIEKHRYIIHHIGEFVTQ